MAPGNGDSQAHSSGQGLPDPHSQMQEEALDQREGSMDLLIVLCPHSAGFPPGTEVQKRA